MIIAEFVEKWQLENRKTIRVSTHALVRKHGGWIVKTSTTTRHVSEIPYVFFAHGAKNLANLWVAEEYERIQNRQKLIKMQGIVSSVI